MLSKKTKAHSTPGICLNQAKESCQAHLCTCLLTQISYANITDMSFTQQTVFHSTRGRKKLRIFFPFPSLQDSCSQEGLAQPCVKCFSNGTDFIPSEKHSSQPRSAQCCWDSPNKQDTLYLARYLSHLQIPNYRSCKTLSTSSSTEMEYNLATR